MNDVQTIKETGSILQCAEELGYHPVKTGNSWQLKEHDSLVIVVNSQGKEEFFWNSRGIYGDIIDFYSAMTGCSFRQALEDLSRHSPAPAKYKNLHSVTEKPAPFRLPDSSQNTKLVFDYLLKRGISPKLISGLLKQKQIYQDVRGNAVFTGKSPITKQAEFACLRGTSTEKQFRMDVRGSRKEVGFYLNLYSKNTPTKLFVCESPIDCLSVATLLLQKKDNLKDYAFLSLGGTSLKSLEYHLPKNPRLQTVYLCQDNDDAGHKSRTHAKAALQKMGFKGKIIDKIPISKDFNEDLQNRLNPTKKEEPIMSLDLSEQAVQVQIKGMEITARLIFDVIKSLVENQSKTSHGKQSLSKLNLQGRELQSVNIDAQDLKQMQQHLKKYAVDFSIKKDPQTDRYSVFFKSQDIERVYLGLQKCVKDYSKGMQSAINPTLDQTAEHSEKPQQSTPEVNPNSPKARIQTAQTVPKENSVSLTKPPIKQTLEQASEKAKEYNQTVKEQAAQHHPPIKQNHRSEQTL